MQKIQFMMNTFQELTVSQLYDLLKLRVEVFVVEQQCAYAELDGKDCHAETRHLLGLEPSGQLIGYARLLPPGLNYPESGIGRFVVRRDARGQGRGRMLFEMALDASQELWTGYDVRVSAQTHLQSFYEKYGFTPLSGPYLEDGISHIDMVRKFSPH